MILWHHTHKTCISNLRTNLTNIKTLQWSCISLRLISVQNAIKQNCQNDYFIFKHPETINGKQPNKLINGNSKNLSFSTNFYYCPSILFFPFFFKVAKFCPIPWSLFRYLRLPMLLICMLQISRPTLVLHKLL